MKQLCLNVRIEYKECLDKKEIIHLYFFMTNTWRLIDSDVGSAAYNMAADEAIAIFIKKGYMPATLRFYKWDSLSVSIGRFQKISDINTVYCNEKNIPIVRRPTGGRAILHGSDLTYSFSVQTNYEPFSKGLFENYKTISLTLCHAMSKLGLLAELTSQKRNNHFKVKSDFAKSPVCFDSASYAEITINNKKVIGSAQRRWENAFLQQGCIPISIQRNEITEIFRLKTGEQINKTLVGLKEFFPEISFDLVENAIISSFEEDYGIKLIRSSISYDEINLARELESGKYLLKQWNYCR